MSEISRVKDDVLVIFSQCSKRREAWRGGTATPQALRAFAKPWRFLRRQQNIYKFMYL